MVGTFWWLFGGEVFGRYALVANVCGAESACVDPRDALTILGRCGLTTIGEVR